MNPVAQEGLCLLYMNLTKAGNSLSKEDLGFRTKCKRRNKVRTFCVLSEAVRPPPHRLVVALLGWENYLSLVLLNQFH